jgi:hypothetical protein
VRGVASLSIDALVQRRPPPLPQRPCTPAAAKQLPSRWRAGASSLSPPPPNPTPRAGQCWATRRAESAPGPRRLRLQTPTPLTAPSATARLATRSLRRSTTCRCGWGYPPWRRHPPALLPRRATTAAPSWQPRSGPCYPQWPMPVLALCPPACLAPAWQLTGPAPPPAFVTYPPPTHTQLAKLRSYFQEDVRKQLYSEEEDKAFFNRIKAQLQQVRAALGVGARSSAGLLPGVPPRCSAGAATLVDRPGGRRTGGEAAGAGALRAAAPGAAPHQRGLRRPKRRGGAAGAGAAARGTGGAPAGACCRARAGCGGRGAGHGGARRQGEVPVCVCVLGGGA